MIKIISLWIIILPFVSWQARYEAPKVFLLTTIGIFCLIFLLLNIKKVLLNKKDYLYFGWLLTLIVSSFFSDNQTASFLGGSYRHQGLVFFMCLWLIMKIHEIMTEKEKSLLYKGIGISIVVQTILVFCGQSLGTIGEPNAVSGFLGIGLYFVYTSLPKWTVIFPLIGMMLELSKSGFLSLLPYLYKKINIVFVLVLLVVLFILKPVNNFSHFENREVIWKHSINQIIKNPIVGYGLESNESIFDKAFYESGFPLADLIIDRAHNLFLDLLLWSGVPGILLFLFFIKESFKDINIDRKKALFSFLIYSMFQPVSVVHWVLFALIV